MKTYFTLFIFLFLLSSCQQEETFVIPDYIQQEFVDLGTHKLAAISFGSGDHTVVFENGLNTDMEIWVEPGIFETIAASNQVIAYNRGGYNTSELGPEPRNLSRLISELNQIIEAKSQNEKVILVGHSLGGSVVRSYAVMYPEKVEGLILIEATHESFPTLTPDDEIALVSSIYAENPNRIGPLMEARQFWENIQYMKFLPELPDIPTVAMLSIKKEFGINDAYINQWIQTHEALGKSITDFKIVATPNSGHQIHVDEPELVIEAILELVN